MSYMMMKKNEVIAHIGTEKFNLPLNNNKELQLEIEKKLSKKIPKRELFHMVKPVDRIENNDFIKPVKNKTNIFFLNLMLLISKNKDIEIPENDYDNDVIISWLEKATKLELKEKQFELVENQVYSLILKKEGFSENKPENQISENQESEVEENFFSLDWVKSKNKEI